MPEPDALPSDIAPRLRPSVTWPVLAWFALLLGVCYWPVLQRMAHDWMIDEDMGHGFFVPVVALYILWQRRSMLESTQWTPGWSGLAVAAFACVQLLAATLGVELFLARAAFLISLAGVILTLGGPPLFRRVLFPYVLLFFMIPLPSIIYNQITFPLQLLASRIAEISLTMFGIPVLRDGNILELPSQRLSVVEACSGIRSLLSLSFLSLVYGYFFEEKTWLRWVLFLLTVPIAIFANSCRVTLTGVVSETDPELAQGVFHTFEGWVIFAVAIVLLGASHKLINLVYGRIRGRG